MIAVRMSADGLSTFPTPRPKRWEWLEAVSQRSNSTSSNSWYDRYGRDNRKSTAGITFDVVFFFGSYANRTHSTASHSPQHVFDIDELLCRPKRQPLDSP